MPSRSFGPGYYAEICPSNLKAHAVKVRVRSTSPKGYSSYCGEIFYNPNGKVGALDFSITRGSAEFILRLRECPKGLYVKEIKRWTVGCRTEKKTVFRVGGSRQYEKALTRMGIEPWPPKSKQTQNNRSNRKPCQKNDPGPHPGKSPQPSSLVSLAAEAGFEMIDKRGSGGCLWIVADESAKATFEKWGEAGRNLKFKAGGGRSTGGRDAWWVK